MLLIDGYNVLFARRPGPRDSRELEAAREALVQDVLAYCRSRRQRARIFFDLTRGAPAYGEARRRRLEDVEVVYLEKGMPADRAIQALMLDEKDRTAYRIVSSDREISEEAARLGFEATGAAEFLDQMARPPAPGKRGPKRDGITDAEAEAWMREFYDPDRPHGPMSDSGGS